MGGPAGEGSVDRMLRSNSVVDSEAAAAAAAVTAISSESLGSGGAGGNGGSAGHETDSFDPLLWLSERLRESVSGPTDHYRDQIEERIVQQFIEEAKAAAALKEEDDTESPRLQNIGERNSIVY